MKRCMLIVSSGLSSLALKEVSECGGKVIDSSLLLCEFTDDVVFACYVQRAQAPTRIVMLSGDEYGTSGKVFSCATSGAASSAAALNIDFPYARVSSFNLEYDNVPGQDVRNGLSAIILPKVFACFEAKKWKVVLDRKRPEVMLVVMVREGRYFFGVDVCGDMARRSYRVFAHASSLRGDVAYRVIREAGFICGQSILIGFAKDGVLAIEAALYALMKGFSRSVSLCLRLPVPAVSTLSHVGASSVCAFESSVPNVRAIDRNSYIAGVKSSIVCKKCSLDDVDVNFDAEEFDVVILVVTQKDEDKLNEMYHQTHYVTKVGGRVAFLGREHWELMIPDQFRLISKVIIERGENKGLLWILEKV